MRCTPGAPAALVLRTEAFVDYSLQVRVDGREVGVWTVPRKPVVWTEPLFEIPGEALTRDTVTLELIRVETGPTVTPYASYHYWLLQ